jgi:thiamine phosphate synthase YjbQ (UPF0047 family)
MAKSNFTETDITGMSANELVKKINRRVKDGLCVLFYEDNTQKIIMRTYDKEVKPDDLALAGD